ADKGAVVFRLAQKQDVVEGARDVVDGNVERGVEHVAQLLGQQHRHAAAAQLVVQRREEAGQALDLSRRRTERDHAVEEQAARSSASSPATAWARIASSRGQTRMPLPVRA